MDPASQNAVSNKQHNTRVSFLDLPAELRNRVYEYAFASAIHQAISIIPKYHTARQQYIKLFIAKAGLIPKTPELALLGACKQVQAEAAPILFSKCHIGLWLGDVKNRGLRSDAELLMDAMVCAFEFFSHMHRYLHLVEHLDIGVQDLLPYVRPGEQAEVDGNDDRFSYAAPNRLMHTIEQLSRAMSISDEEGTEIEDLEFASHILKVLKPCLTNIRTITFHRTKSDRLLQNVGNYEPFARLVPTVEEAWVIVETARHGLLSSGMPRGGDEFMMGWRVQSRPGFSLRG